MKKTEEFVKPKMTFGDALRFTPYAWAKMLWMRDRGDTEVAGYATTATPDPLLVTDFRLVKQNCTSVSFDLDPDDLIEDVENALDDGLAPWQTHNILCHTHPGNSPNPSVTDENNFEMAFSHPNWAIMFIIAEGGAAYCRLKINIGPGMVKELKVVVDWKTPFVGTDIEEWKREYDAKVKEVKFCLTGKNRTAEKQTVDDFLSRCGDDPNDPLWYNEQEDKWIGFSHAQQNETDNYLDIDCHWDANGDVAYWCETEEKWFYYDPIRQTWFAENADIDAEIIEVEPPNEDWVEQVVSWANIYADERQMALVEDDG